MKKEVAVLDLPPAPSAYVEICRNVAPAGLKDLNGVLKADDHEPPEPPHDHVEEPPPSTPPTPDEPPGDAFRVQQEVARRRNEEDLSAWRVHAMRFNLFNQSGADYTLPS